MTLKPSGPAVAAVVVTYNRLQLLQRCIAALRGQTRKLDEIIIVNNGSSDGTLEWLQQQPDLTVITQGNLGSAGGQHTGIKAAYARGHDWVWCLDDDGYGEPNALEKLLEHAGNGTADWLNSLVIDCNNEKRLAFGLEPFPADGRVQTVAEAKKLGALVESANPFNGTLLSRQLIDKVGFPCPALFIWGDELEFYRRARDAGARIRTVVDSHYYHPGSVAVPSQTSLKGFYKYYYLVRNSKARGDWNGEVHLTPKAARQVGMLIIKHLFTDAIALPVKNLIKIGIVLHAIFAAYVNDTSRRYL